MRAQGKAACPRWNPSSPALPLDHPWPPTAQGGTGGNGSVIHPCEIRSRFGRGKGNQEGKRVHSQPEDREAPVCGRTSYHHGRPGGCSRQAGGSRLREHRGAVPVSWTGVGVPLTPERVQQSFWDIPLAAGIRKVRPPRPPPHICDPGHSGGGATPDDQASASVRLDQYDGGLVHPTPYRAATGQEQRP